MTHFGMIVETHTLGCAFEGKELTLHQFASHQPEDDYFPTTNWTMTAAKTAN